MKHNFYSPFQKPITYIILLAIVAGGFSFTYLQKSLFPEITFPKIKIIADNGEQPVDKMMVTVTKPLEIAIKKIPGLRMIRNTTSRGSSEISAFLDWDADIYTSQQLIESRISEIRNQLPPNTKLTIERMNPSILPVMGFLLKGKDKNLIELTQIAKYTIRPFLSQLAGISQIQVQGGKEKQFWATLNADAMSRLGVTPAKIKSAISSSGFIESNGFATDYRRLYLTLTDAAAYSLKDMQDLVISGDQKRVITLADISSISVHQQIQYVKVNTNGREGVLVNVIKQPGKNLVDLSSQVKAKVAALQKILPKGVRLTRYYDQGDFVGASIRSVIDAIWIGLVIAIIIVILFLRSFRSSATLLITIPTTLALTLVVLYNAGYTLNLMTLGAIAAAIGLIIDDAIIVVEQIHRLWEEFPDESTSVHIQKAVKYLFPALVSSSLSTIVIFFPFSLMSGVAGAYFKVLADTMIITLVCSFFVVWLALPVIYMILSGSGKSESRTTHNAEPARWSLFLNGKPFIAILFMAIMIALSFIVIPRMPTGFLPQMDEGTIILDYNSPPGTSLTETNRILQSVDKIVSNTPEVANYSRRTGTQLGFFITEPNRGDYLIQLKNSRSKTTSQVINDIRTKIEQSVPALRADFGQVISDMLGDLMSSVQPIQIKIFGNDPAILQTYAKKVAGLMKKVRGTADVFDGIVIAGPSITIKPDAQELAYYNMTPADLQLQLQTHIQGVQLAGILEKQQETPLQMIYPDHLRKNVSSIGKTEILLPDGTRKSLDELATVRKNSGSAEVERENLQPMIPVTSRLQNRSLGKTVQAIKTTIQQHISLPKGYHIEYGGAYANQQKSFSQLLMILIASSLLVFSVSLFFFRQIWASLVILLVSLVGMAGSCLALYLTGTELNVGSYTGIIMIVGIIAENAIFTYQQFQQTYGKEDMELDDAVAYAISLRLRPNLMTASAAIAALMPLALAIGTGAEMHQPLAIAVIGGFLVALPLLLVVLPTFIRLLYKVSST